MRGIPDPKCSTKSKSLKTLLNYLIKTTKTELVFPISIIVRKFANSKIKHSMSKKELTKEQENIARIAKALAHPVRIAILQMLASQACCYHGDMSEVIPVAKSTLSQHLKELREAGLIQGAITPPSVKYCINEENWQMAKNIIADFFTDIKLETSCEI